MKISFTGGFIKTNTNGIERYINTDTIRKIYSNNNEDQSNPEEKGKTAIYYNNNLGYEVINAPASIVAAACIKARNGSIVEIPTYNSENQSNN